MPFEDPEEDNENVSGVRGLLNLGDTESPVQFEGELVVCLWVLPCSICVQQYGPPLEKNPMISVCTSEFEF